MRIAFVILVGLLLLSVLAAGSDTPGAKLPVRQMERLGRGVVEVPVADGAVFVSWRLLGTDATATAFNVYRTTEGVALKLNAEPVTKRTHFTDAKPDRAKANAYHVRAVQDGKEGNASAAFVLPANAPVRNYL